MLERALYPTLTMMVEVVVPYPNGGTEPVSLTQIAQIHAL